MLPTVGDRARRTRNTRCDARADPESEFTGFYEREASRLLRSVSLVTGEPALAEEAIAEAFAKAWSHWAKVRAHAKPAAWVMRVALNECNSRFRRRKLERRKAHSVARPDLVRDPEPHTNGHVWVAVAGLPEPDRTMIALRYVADLSQAEVAEVLGVPPGTVASGLNRARKRLGIQLRSSYLEETS